MCLSYNNYRLQYSFFKKMKKVKLRRSKEQKTENGRAKKR
jgi:hypothetical protein